LWRGAQRLFTGDRYDLGIALPRSSTGLPGASRDSEQITMGYLFLAFAIVSEVVATTFLRVVSGPNSPWWPYIVVVVGYVLSFVMLSQTLRADVPLGIAYAIWAGVGVVLVALISWLVFHEPLTLVQIGGIVLVIAGVGLLELGGRHPADA
jgi:small multidrug resistance pump